MPAACCVVGVWNVVGVGCGGRVFDTLLGPERSGTPTLPVLPVVWVVRVGVGAGFSGVTLLDVPLRGFVWGCVVVV